MAKPTRLWVQVRCPPLAMRRLMGLVTPGSAVAAEEEGESMSGRRAVTPMMSDAATTWVRGRSPSPAPSGTVVTVPPALSGGMLSAAVPKRAIPAATPETTCECPIMSTFLPVSASGRAGVGGPGDWVLPQIAAGAHRSSRTATRPGSAGGRTASGTTRPGFNSRAGPIGCPTARGSPAGATRTRGQRRPTAGGAVCPPVPPGPVDGQRSAGPAALITPGPCVCAPGPRRGAP